MNIFNKILIFWRSAGIEGKFLLGYPILMSFITRSKHTNSEILDQTSISLQIIYTLIVFIFLFSNLIKSKTKKILSLINTSPLALFFLFIFTSFLSFIWSINPILTIYRSFEMLIFTWLIISVIYNLFNSYTIEIVIQWLIFYAFWNLTFDTFGRFILTGNSPFFIPFNPSRLFFPLFTFLIILYAKNLKLKLILISVIIFGLSTKVFLGISMGLISFLFGNNKLKLALSMLIISIFSILLFIDFNDLLLNTVFYGREKVGLEDSTGRNIVWEFLIEKGMEKPFLGYGFASGEEYLLKSKGLGAINAHNTFISCFIGSGLLGLILILLFFLKIIKLVIVSKFKIMNFKSVLLGSLIIILIVSSSGPGIGSRVFGAWIPSMVLIVFTIFSCKYVAQKNNFT